MSKYGIKISKEGVDVNTAEDHELLVSSEFPMFKISEQGTVNIKMHQTTLSSDINSSQTTIALSSTSGLASSGHVWIEYSDFSDYEAVSYTGISGNSLTGCTRARFNSTASSASSGRRVVAGYNEVSIAHGLSFPPVHFVFLTDSSVLSDTGTTVPRPFASFDADPFGQQDYLDAWVTSTDLHISVNYEQQFGSHIVTSGDDEYDFSYMVMADSITTPYY